MKSELILVCKISYLIKSMKKETKNKAFYKNLKKGIFAKNCIINNEHVFHILKTFFVIN